MLFLLHFMIFVSHNGDVSPQSLRHRTGNRFT